MFNVINIVPNSFKHLFHHCFHSGYQRQLNYRHPDYSYSAWGGSGSGSMWLTAFVVKCLRQSSPYIEVDQDDVTKSIRWFLSRQQSNGCFPKVGYTHSYYLKGGISDRSNEASMTAFVLISILESGQMDSFVSDLYFFKMNKYLFHFLLHGYFFYTL